MIKQAAAAPRPCRAKPQLPHPSPFPGALSGPAGFLFPQTASKIGCFGAFADRKFIRMAAKLRPAGRQTTPPGRAGIPHMQSKRNSTIFSQVFGKAIQSGPACRKNKRCQNHELARCKGTPEAGQGNSNLTSPWREQPF